MATPTAETLQAYWDWFYQQNREEIEKQVVDAVISGQSFVKMTEDGFRGRDYWWIWRSSHA